MYHLLVSPFPFWIDSCQDLTTQFSVSVVHIPRMKGSCYIWMGEKVHIRNIDSHKNRNQYTLPLSENSLVGFICVLVSSRILFYRVLWFLFVWSLHTFVSICAHHQVFYELKYGNNGFSTKRMSLMDVWLDTCM